MAGIFIRLDGKVLEDREGGWLLHDELPSDIERVWVVDKPDLTTEKTSLLELAREVEAKLGKENAQSAMVLRLEKKVNIYPQRPLEDYTVSYLDAVSESSGAVYGETIFNYDGVTVGALLVGVSEDGSSAKIVMSDSHPNWQRIMLTSRKGITNTYHVSPWLHNQIGEANEIAKIKVKVELDGVLFDLLNKQQKALIGTGFSEWKRKEASKSKAKNLTAFAMIGLGLLAMGGSWLLDKDTKDMKERVQTLNQQLATLSAQRLVVEQRSFFVDWLTTPSLVDVMRRATGSLGPVQITSMKGKVEIGKYAEVEGIALALDGSINPLPTKGLKIETVMTKGKVGLRFVLREGNTNGR